MRSQHRYIQRFGSFYRHRGNLYYFIIKEGKHRKCILVKLLPPKNAYCKFQGGVVVEAARVKLIFLHHLVGHCLGKLTATQLRRQGSANI